MAEASFASLSPTLLARKGGAKPAMRPQHAALAAMPASNSVSDPDKLEDLGWNDMGENDDQVQTAEVVQFNPGKPATDNITAPEPTVLRQRETIAERIAPVRKAKIDKSTRAAFTLRLDTDRHLKLRLACTVRDCSAQALVTEALDALLGEMPELEALAAQVKRR
ncbi:hypothetical protein A6F68_02445 [Tsuneonella dongtanensis]|uniref:Uncharacterized protein n=1 Tax=Tsuneonella dongtanensis TaxID=692370 RepID=A0A1B2AFL7_9SPHN|nr:hypothetical protein [Tsuneonella dongtanensis]ANY20942.1 hypothetical protein A6F68_02445 [Tsuneonella dongtanensis]